MLPQRQHGPARLRSAGVGAEPGQRWEAQLPGRELWGTHIFAAFGGFWLLAAFGFWRVLAFGGFWLVAAFGLWWLLAFGGFCSEGCFHIDH